MALGKDYNPHLDSSDRSFWETKGEAMRKAHEYLLSDMRLDVLMLPLFDGMIQIKWKPGYFNTQELA